MNARRVYIGNVDPSVHTSASVADFLSDAVAAANATPWHASNPARTRAVERCRVDERGFGFAECVALEDVEAILALDGSLIDGVRVKLRRPKDYDPRSNPLVTSGTLDEVRRRTRDVVVSPEVSTSAPARMFVGCSSSTTDAPLEDELRQMVTAFGALKSWRADVDASGTVRTGAWFEYREEPSAAAAAAEAGLTGTPFGGGRLVAALAPAENDTERYAVPAAAAPLLEAETRVLAFGGILTPDMSAAARDAAAEECREECATFGNVLSAHVEPPATKAIAEGGAERGAEVGAEGKGGDHLGELVFVEFARVETATAAAHALHRRAFDGRVVSVGYFSVDEYRAAFGKGVPPRTEEERQEAALRALEYLANEDFDAAAMGGALPPPGGERG